MSLTARIQNYIDIYENMGWLIVKYNIMRLIAKTRIRTIKVKPISIFKGKGHNMKIKTHCPSGHEYNQENTRYSKNGSRICIICKRLSRNKSRDVKRKAAYNQSRADHKPENRVKDGGKEF